MKKRITSILLVIFVFSFSAVVFANSGPVFWRGYPSSDILSIDVDSPIVVDHENLVFDFSDCDDSAYTISGRVKATYEMVNPTNEAQSVQMAFPFVENLNSSSLDDIMITSDNCSLPYDIYIGDSVESFRDSPGGDRKISFDFSNILDTITDELYTAKNFGKDEKGKLYVINVSPTTDQYINFVVDFNFDYEKTKILTSGFNRYERNDKKTKIAAWCCKPEVLEIFVLGEDIDLKISAYTDGELKKTTDLFTHRISTQLVEVKPYLMAYIKENTAMKTDGRGIETQLYNLYAKSLDGYFEENMGYSFEDDLRAQESCKRIITLVYTVDFPQNSKKEIRVSYKASGTMDKTESAKPTYTFDYMLNPAENWKDFKNLNIEIITPQVAPYIARSNIEFFKNENGLYTATLEDLPKGDLSFTLYAHEKIDLLDKIEGNLRYHFGYFFPVLIGFIVLSAIASILVVVIKRNRPKC